MGPLRYGQFQALALLGISCLILSSGFAKADDASNDLVQLARKHKGFNYEALTPPEQRAFDKFFQSIQQGERADFGGGLFSHSAEGKSWGLDRTVNASWIRWACEDPAAKMVRIIRIAGAKIDGALDLAWLKMEFPLWFLFCYFTHRIDLYGASVRDVVFQGIYIDAEANRELAFNAIGLTVQGQVALDLHVKSLVLFTNAKITGTFELTGGDYPYGLDATAATIDGDALITPDHAKKLSFFAAKVGGAFQLNRSEDIYYKFPANAVLDLGDANARVFSNPATGWPVQGNLLLQGFVFSELGGRGSLDPKIQIDWLRLQSPFVIQPYEQMATVFRNMGYEQASVKVSIAGRWDEGVQAIKNYVDSMDSASKAIYNHLRQRKVWKAFGSGWELVQDIGQVLLAWIWYFGFGWVIQYGYRPWNALYISIGFVVLGTMIFGFAEQKKILKKKDSDAATSNRNYSAFIYSLEAFVPLVKLGVADVWKIDAGVIEPIRMGSVLLREPGRLVLRYYWIHIIAGWVFTSLWVAAFTGILKH